MKTVDEMVTFCLQNKYDYSAGIRICKHFEIIERNLPSNAEVVFAFTSNGVDDRDGHHILGGLTAVAFTDKTLMYAQRRPVQGDYFKSVSYENVNDISSKKGWVFGELIIDSITEYMKFKVEKVHVEPLRNVSYEIIEQYRGRKNATSSPQEHQVSVVDDLKKFKELLDMNIITQEEFDAKKRQLLGL